MKNNKKSKAQQKKSPQKEQKEQDNVPQSIKKPQSQQKKPGKILIIVGAKPNSKQSKISQINDEYVGVNIAAPPKQGQANEELISHLTYVLGVKKNTVYLDKGAKSKHKVVVVETTELSAHDVYEKLKMDLDS